MRYDEGVCIATNTIEGYFETLKRGINGVYHHVDRKHLHRYLSEFQFRWNNRESQEIFMLVIAALVIGSAMPYKNLIEPLPGETATGPAVSLDGETF